MGWLFALVTAILFLPVHLVIAALIRFQDGGPVFYRSSRMGKDGRPFGMFKYRSMRVGSTPRVGEGFKTIVAAGDRRVTPIGRILRCGLDEIPQLLNVIRGDMAWIGPRPDELWMLPRYGPATFERVSVLPGITGLAQVCDSRNLSTPQSYALEIWAVRHRSAGLTLRIVSMTPLFILGWRRIGQRLREQLLANPEVRGLEQASEQELKLVRAVS